MKDKYKLDKSDKVILTNLEFNSRILEKDLATLCHLSKDAIRYRIRKLENDNIITGYSCFVDYTKLGRFPYKIYLKIRGSEENWEKLRSFLDTLPAVFVRFESQSDWNFGIVYFAQSLYDYYQFERLLFSRFGSIIESSQLSQMLDAHVYESRMFLEKKRETFELFGELKKEEVDSIDVIILETLLRDSSQSLLDIAHTAKLSPDATKKRIQRLQKDQIIRRFITGINYPKLGYEIYKVFIWVTNYTEEAEKKIFTQLSDYHSIRNIIRMIGPWKLEVEFACKDFNELFEILKDLRLSFPNTITSMTYSLFRNDVYYPSKKVVQ